MNGPAKSGATTEAEVRAELERQQELRRRNPVFAVGQLVAVGQFSTPFRVHSIGDRRIVLDVLPGVHVHRGRLLTDEEFAARQKAAQEPA